MESSKIINEEMLENNDLQETVQKILNGDSEHTEFWMIEEFQRFADNDRIRFADSNSIKEVSKEKITLDIDAFVRIHILACTYKELKDSPVYDIVRRMRVKIARCDDETIVIVIPTLKDYIDLSIYRECYVCRKETLENYFWSESSRQALKQEERRNEDGK